MRSQRVLDRSWNRTQRRLVEHNISACNEGLAHRTIADIASDEGETRIIGPGLDESLIDVAKITGGKVVEPRSRSGRGEAGIRRCLIR